MKLLPEDRERLIKYVDFMKSEFADFSKFSKVDWKTYNDDRDKEIHSNLRTNLQNVH